MAEHISVNIKCEAKIDKITIETYDNNKLFYCINVADIWRMGFIAALKLKLRDPTT